jgi:RNA recognition motif-containing protein
MMIESRLTVHRAEVFKNIENVVNVRVAVDRRTGQPRGFAHADFVDLESAQRAKEILETKSLYGRELRIDFSESVPKDSGAGSGPRRTSGYQQRE